MIASLMRAQRGDMDRFGLGLGDVIAGRDTPDAEAALFNLASAITVMANSVTENKWSKG